MSIKEILDAEIFGKADVDDPLRGPREEDDSRKLSERLLEATNAMVAATGVDPRHAAKWLLHTDKGRALLSTIKTEKGNTPMIEITKLDINKLSNPESVIEVAKNIVADKVTMTEHQFEQMLSGHAKLAGTTLEKILTDPANVEIRQAYRISKGQAQTEA
jgi:hypothetical protein